MLGHKMTALIHKDVSIISKIVILGQYLWEKNSSGGKQTGAKIMASFCGPYMYLNNSLFAIITLLFISYKFVKGFLAITF